MRILTKVYGGGDLDIYMAVVDFDPVHVLALMDDWPDLPHLSEMHFDDCAWWCEAHDVDVLDVLERDPIIEFDHVDLGAEARVVC